MTSVDWQTQQKSQSPAELHATQWQTWLMYGGYTVFVISLLMADVSRSIAGLKPGELLLVLFVGALALRRIINRDFSFVTTPIDFGFLLLIVTGHVPISSPLSLSA